MSEKSKNALDFEKEKLRLEYLFESNIDLAGRIIRITGPIGDQTYEEFDSQLSELERMNTRKTIFVRINSPGGSVYDALAIVGRMKASSCPIVTEAYGHVMSAATLILASGKRRKMSRFAMFMHHKSQYMVGGSHDEVVDEVRQQEREEKLWSEWMSEFSKKSPQFWSTAAKKKNYYATAQECLDLGVIDEII
jgi:ATP-dependent Clp protease protease subunit